MSDRTENDSAWQENASLFALDALDELERARVLRERAQASAADQDAFDAEVVAVRETLARLSHATAAEPSVDLRQRLLDQIADEPQSGPITPTRQGGGRRPMLVAAAVAAAIALGAAGAVFGYSIAGRDDAPSSSVEEIYAAPDVRTTTGEVAGGTATITYSPSTGQGVLVMNQVPQPAPGTIYQMWLDGPTGPRLAGTMSESDVAPSTTAVLTDMRGATAVSFTVGSPDAPDQRVGDTVASLPLS